jgi:ABC-type transport system substrate-binding protein
MSRRAEIIFPPQGVISARQSNFVMVDKVEAPDPTTVVFRLKFATDAFLPALDDPYAWIYKKAILDEDPHWYEKNILGSGPFKFVAYDIGQSIKGERNPDYYRKGLPYLDGFTGIFAEKQAVRVEAIRADRAASEFRGLPPATVDELKKALGDKITVQTSDWNCSGVVTPNQAIQLGTATTDLACSSGMIPALNSGQLDERLPEKLNRWPRSERAALGRRMASKSERRRPRGKLITYHEAI